MQTIGSVRRRALTNGGNAIAGEGRPEHGMEKLPDFSGEPASGSSFEGFSICLLNRNFRKIVVAIF